MNTLGLDDVSKSDPLLHNLTALSFQAPGTAVQGGKDANNGGGNARMAQVDLGDLFSDLSVPGGSPGTSTHVNTSRDLNEQNKAHKQKPILQQPKPQPQKQGLVESSDPLDTFFNSAPSNVPPVSNVTHDDVCANDLFDFSRPGERARYSDERSFLEAFENQGKGKRGETRDGPSLADLSKGSSGNKVKARLLKIMNYYDVLGVTFNATPEEIRKQYKKKALELHPDRVGRDQTEEEAELFKVMTKAHEILCDAEERAKYDAELRSSSNGATGEATWLFHLHQE
ncbi:putative DnaJ chaperone protein [Trypanosoma theileri]|uniref:Putative DnaJ chaperone protein n=1 Tax=Trypanosoma theileri TaxID=67003 RepID=A0A1X0P8E8_9TRYP|nr:putative DnaJ chaperone protein [Trypanosoma theileri]ORC93148.1 putative DnaJ chaperone protein [Trypanosoma theileri]